MDQLSAEKETTSKVVVPETAKDRGVMRGGVTHPWGTVKDATVAAGEKTALSDGKGAYEISGLALGTYNVTAQAPFPGYEAVPQKVDLAAGETKVVDIYLDFEKTVVEGHVYDVDGKPISSATLSGVSYGKGMETTTTDERGHFKFEKVTPGDRFIRVNATGYMGETRDFTARKDSTTTLEFRLTPAPFKVYGNVRDENGKPLQVEILLLKSGIVVQKTNTNPETGYYEFPVLAGRYEILSVAPGYTAKGWYGEISADTRVDLSLTPAQVPEVAEGQR